MPFIPLSDEPMASTMMMSGSSSSIWSLTDGLKTTALEDTTNSEDRSQRSGFSARVSTSGRAMASPVITIVVTRLASMASKHRLCAEVADEHHGVALEEKPQRAPLGGAVHQRRGVQRHHWRVGCSGLVGQFLAVGDPFVGVGVHPAAERIEHVLVAPHHPLGHAGGAAGVEHVEVVARAFQLRTVGAGVGNRVGPRHRTHSGRVGVAAVLDHHEVPQAGHASVTASMRSR
jgi:hypothetical protein